MIYLNSDTLYTLDNLTDEVTGDYVNDASVTGYLLSLVDESVLTSFDMNYVAESDGTYQGVLTAEQAATYCVDCGQYIIEVQAVEDAGTTTFRETEPCGYRGFN